MKEPPTPTEVRQVLLRILATGEVRFTSHALTEMASDLPLGDNGRRGDGLEDEVKCIECGGRMKTTRENFRHEALGLPVTLVGVEVSRCGGCGLSEVSIPQLEGLHRAIASALVSKTARLTPDEIRFLRGQLGWSGAELGDHLGVTRETISRWEQGSAPIGATADRLLRATLALATGISLRTETLREIGRGDPAPLALRLHHDSAGWMVDPITPRQAKRSRRASATR